MDCVEEVPVSLDAVATAEQREAMAERLKRSILESVRAAEGDDMEFHGEPEFSVEEHPTDDTLKLAVLLATLVHHPPGLSRWAL